MKTERLNLKTAQKGLRSHRKLTTKPLTSRRPMTQSKSLRRNKYKFPHNNNFNFLKVTWIIWG